MYEHDYIGAILEWGKTKILSPHIIKYREDIEEYCKPLLESNEDELCDLLLRAIGELKDQVESAISTFGDIKLVTSTEYEELWHKAGAEFCTFDKINYLMESVHYLICIRDKRKYNEILQELDNVFSRITLWIEEGDFSPLRFVVLNEIRCESLLQIPEDERYRFPWYEAYSDYADDTVGIIIENFNLFLSGNWDKLITEIPREHLIEVSFELKRDRQLFSVIELKAALHKNLLETMSKPTSLKLLAMWDDARLDYYLPEKVVEVGPGKVRDEVLKDVTSSREDTLFGRFLNAFCGPGMDDRQRLNRLSKVEEEIKEVDISKASSPTKEVLSTLKLWFEGKCEDGKLTKISFETWLGKMERKANEIDTESFNAHLETLLRGVPGLTKFLEEDVAKEPILEGSLCTIDLDDQQASTQKEQIPIKQNPVGITLRLDREESISIMPDPDNIRASEDYKELWKFIDKVEDWYWGGTCFAEDKKK